MRNSEESETDSARPVTDTYYPKIDSGGPGKGSKCPETDCGGPLSTVLMSLRLGLRGLSQLKRGRGKGTDGYRWYMSQLGLKKKEKNSCPNCYFEHIKCPKSYLRLHMNFSKMIIFY